jgi:hypothetical protein
MEIPFDQVCVGQVKQDRFLSNVVLEQTGWIRLPTMIPVELLDARYLVSLFCMENYPEIQLTMLVYHSDSRKINTCLNSFMGCCIDKQGSRLIQFESKGELIDEPTPNHVMEEIGISSDTLVQKNSLSSCRYDILTSSVPADINVESNISSTISLHVDWNGFDAIKSVPINPCNIQLDVFYVSGQLDPDNHEATLDLQKQLDNLTTCCNAIGITGNPHESNSMAIHVQQLLEKINQNGYQYQDSNSDSLLFQPLPKRTNIDFIDLFWNLVQRAKTPNELSETIALVVNELENGSLLPLVSNSLSRLVKQIHVNLRL